LKKIVIKDPKGPYFNIAHHWIFAEGGDRENEFLYFNKNAIMNESNPLPK
jgi:hypothetical protein